MSVGVPKLRNIQPTPPPIDTKPRKHRKRRSPSPLLGLPPKSPTPEPPSTAESSLAEDEEDKEDFKGRILVLTIYYHQGLIFI